MKQTGLLFTPENYTKCENGSKPITRRLNGLNAVNERPDDWEYGGVNVHGQHIFYHKTDESNEGCAKLIRCPYGTVGDRLYVKEAHYLYGSWSKVLVKGTVRWRFAYDQSEGVRFCDNPPDNIKTARIQQGWFLRSPLFMPQWAARLWLELTEVRVERVQEITEEDAKKEGIEYHDGRGIGHSGYRHSQEHGYVYATARDAFKVLWESINGADSWDLNPWVWVLEYKRVSP